jgi:hypothetical protein
VVAGDGAGDGGGADDGGVGVVVGGGRSLDGDPELHPVTATSRAAARAIILLIAC